MKTISIFTIVMLVLVLIVSHDTCFAGNLLKDSGFELSTANGTFPDSGFWKKSWAPLTAGAVCTTTAAHNGNNGLWEYTGKASSAYWSGQYQSFPAKSGSKYSANGWARTPSGWPWVSGSIAQIRSKFLDRNGATLKIYKSKAITKANSGWKSLSVNIPAAPRGTASVRFIFYLEKPKKSGQSVVNFDDGTLEKS